MLHTGIAFNGCRIHGDATCDGFSSVWTLAQASTANPRDSPSISRIVLMQ
jgi:hypothetical protein